MAERITIFYDQPQHTQTVTLDGAEYRIRLTYRRRLRSWYMDLYDAEGTPLALGRRLSPGWSPTAGLITDGPPGVFYVRGVDPYERDGVELIYVTEAELEQAEPSTSELRVVLT